MKSVDLDTPEFSLLANKEKKDWERFKFYHEEQLSYQVLLPPTSFPGPDLVLYVSPIVKYRFFEYQSPFVTQTAKQLTGSAKSLILCDLRIVEFPIACATYDIVSFFFFFTKEDIFDYRGNNEHIRLSYIYLANYLMPGALSIVYSAVSATNIFCSGDGRYLPLYDENLRDIDAYFHLLTSRQSLLGTAGGFINNLEKVLYYLPHKCYVDSQGADIKLLYAEYQKRWSLKRHDVDEIIKIWSEGGDKCEEALRDIQRRHQHWDIAADIETPHQGKVCGLPFDQVIKKLGLDESAHYVKVLRVLAQGRYGQIQDLCGDWHLLIKRENFDEIAVQASHIKVNMDMGCWKIQPGNKMI